MIELRNLSVQVYSDFSWCDVVRDVSFVIQDRETYALVGESGCGKSMTALALARLLPESARIRAGELLCGGQEIFSLPESAMCDVRGGLISMIFQEPSTSLNPVMTAGEQIAEVLRLHGTRESTQETLRWLERVGFDEPKRIARAYPFELSGGQKQRVMIAMALAAKPSVVIADEPTTALDVTLQAQILDLLDELKREEGISLLLITHDLALVKRYADRVALMYAGQIVEESSSTDFFANPSHPYAQGLLRAVPSEAARGNDLIGIPGVVPGVGVEMPGCRFAPRCRVCRKGCIEKPIELYRLQPGHAVRCLVPEASVPIVGQRLNRSSRQGEVVLEVKDLTVDFRLRGGFRGRRLFRAVDSVSLTLHAGETLALVGESGSGKTTLAKALLRLLPHGSTVSGEARLGSIDVFHAEGEELKKLRCAAQIVFQDPFASLNPRMSIGECLEEGMVSLRVLRNKAQRRQRVKELLELVGLPSGSETRLPHEFSGGQRQRIALARVLALEPKIIVCDEPTSALDVSVQAQILNLMREIQERTGVAYLFITHNFAVVEFLADSVVVMRHGSVVEAGPAQAVLHQAQAPYTRGLLAAVPRL